MTNLEHDVKLDDIDQPFKPFLKNSMYQLSTSIFKSYYTEIQEIRINTDKSLIFTEMEETKSYKFINTRESVDTRKFHIFPGTFSQMLFITTGNTQIHIRSYKKLFDVIVQIGGFFNGIVYCANIILYFYSKNIILWHCISGILSSDEIKDNLDNKSFIHRYDREEHINRIINFRTIKVEPKSNSQNSGQPNQNDNNNLGTSSRRNILISEENRINEQNQIENNNNLVIANSRRK